LVLYNSKRPHKSLELMTPVDYILRESKNCNMWWTHTITKFGDIICTPNSLNTSIMLLCNALRPSGSLVVGSKRTCSSYEVYQSSNPSLRTTGAIC
ncbi:hypothetical protein QA652_24405, partial [Klebsiella pneumoniae]|nr:hypothetical protein [Klebsiella pneumoniae]